MAFPPAASLDEFKRHLDKSLSDTSQDVELTSTLTAATAAAEGHKNVGPIITREFVSRVQSGPIIVLPKRPVVAVTEIAGMQGGPTYGVDTVEVDEAAGLLLYVGGFACGWYKVTYTAGRFAAVDTVDEDIQLAVCIIGKHLWETQRGNDTRAGILGRGQEAPAAPPKGFLIPNRAATLLQPYTSPGMA